MTSFAGSAGDPNAPQLIIDNRAVQLEYARDMSDKKKDFNQNNRFNNDRGKDDKRPVKTDWLCEACGCHNFARRDTCFRCLLPRTENAVSVSQSGELFGDSMISTDSPSCFLVVRGFASFVTEQQLTELFRQFATVKSVHIIRDPQNRTSRGFAYVEFHTIEHAAYALQCSADLKLNNMDLKIAYAKESVMQQLLIQAQNVQAMNIPTRFTANPGLQNALVAQAMQAAQWSMNNGFSSAAGVVGVAGIGGVPPFASTVPAVPAAAFPTGVAVPNVPGAISVKPPVLWPPNFDTHGGSYVFQPKTGYFFDPISHYYYCPKSKLYYNATDGTYYQYDITIDPPFKKYELPLPTEAEEPAPVTDAAVTNEPSNNKTSRPLVSVSLKTKVKAAVAPSSKKVMQDLAKWGAIQKEEEANEESEQIEANNNSNSVFVKRGDANKTNKPTMTSGSVVSNSTVSPHTPDNSLTTSVDPTGPQAATPVASGSASTGNTVPICNLCRRQFASLEMLARHEKESKLHADNLAKQKQQQQQPQYRDRAEERREKYGSVPDHIPKTETAPAPTLTALPAAAASLILPPPPPTKPPVAVADDLSNPGNQMLRKMGWKEGQGLGKDGEGKEVALAVELTSNQQNSSMYATLKSTTGTSSGGGSGGPGSVYKDHVYNAARNRFEQLYK
eukprot:CAMPEP_0173159692 /NCGR_PEP_ID=MMETSP1105-20130129/17294_1 /TAXON_ID=2985 /ORGANISM="Ochromonas sp., Strain BG-1" /LENGTH=671 /DNA_ID=CAMNT_0014078241 /DNA_START=620 /DNA_END=2635 /DNA_ORIENTATION=+